MQHPASSPQVADLFGPGIDDEVREVALARTRDLAKKIKAISTWAELPAEAIASLFEVYTRHLDQVVAERRAPKIVNRHPMEIHSGGLKILPGQRAQICSRSQMALFRVEDLEISEHAERWRVCDILVGIRSQMVYSGDGIAGKHFAKDGAIEAIGGAELRALMRDLRLEVLHGAMDFTLVVEYVGPEVDGEEFRAQAIGTAAAYSY
jgi:hypothetical protein